jgi:hypothetical protein
LAWSYQPRLQQKVRRCSIDSLCKTRSPLCLSERTLSLSLSLSLSRLQEEAWMFPDTLSWTPSQIPDLAIFVVKRQTSKRIWLAIDSCHDPWTLIMTLQENFTNNKRLECWKLFSWTLLQMKTWFCNLDFLSKTAFQKHVNGDWLVAWSLNPNHYSVRKFALQHVLNVAFAFMWRLSSVMILAWFMLWSLKPNHDSTRIFLLQHIFNDGFGFMWRFSLLWSLFDSCYGPWTLPWLCKVIFATFCAWGFWIQVKIESALKEMISNLCL